MIDNILFPILIGLGLILTFVALQLRQRRGPARAKVGIKPTAAILEKLREQTLALDRRGAIIAVTTEAGVPGLTLTRLGPVHLTREMGKDATGSLARMAAARYPEAQVLTRVMQQKENNRVEWRAIVCAAQPDDPSLLPALQEGQPFALVDGANVLNWERNAGLADDANLASLIGVLNILRSEGMGALVVFDASVGHMLNGRYMNEADLHRALGNRRDVRVDVVGKGEVADRHLIELGLQSGAEIVTNDLFRNHTDAHFLRKRRGFSVGGYVELLSARGTEQRAELATG